MEVKFTPIIQDGTILEKWNNSPHSFSSRARMIWSSQNTEIKNQYDLSIPDKKEEYKDVSLIIRCWVPTKSLCMRSTHIRPWRQVVTVLYLFESALRILAIKQLRIRAIR